MIEGSRDRTMDLASLKALAHPLRVQLLEMLSAYGPSTASALADNVGESSGATSYHLRQLERHGFVREVPGRGVGRERWWERVPEPITVEIEPDSDPAVRAASELILGEWQRSWFQRLNQFLAHGRDEVGQEWVDSSLVTTTYVEFTKDQARALNAELAAVVDRYIARHRGQRVPGARPFQIHLDVFPMLDGVVQSDEAGGAAGTRPAERG